MDILDSERNFLITHRHPTQSEPTELCLQIVVPIDKQTMIQELDETIMKHRKLVADLKTYNLLKSWRKI